MKKRTRRALTLTLALLLMLTLAGTASAATVGWYTGETYNRAVVTKTSSGYYVYQKVGDATIVNHTYGTDSLITWPTGYRARYSVDEPQGIAAYRTYWDQALAREGLALSVSSNVPEMDYYVVDEGVPSGYYSYGMEITAYDISWLVQLDTHNVLDGVDNPVDTYALVLPGYYEGTIDAVAYNWTACKLIPMN